MATRGKAFKREIDGSWIPHSQTRAPRLDTIKRRCARIQAKWSPETEERRRCSAHRTKPVEITVVSTAAWNDAMQGEVDGQEEEV